MYIILKLFTKFEVAWYVYCVFLINAENINILKKKQFANLFICPFIDDIAIFGYRLDHHLRAYVLGRRTWFPGGRLPDRHSRAARSSFRPDRRSPEDCNNTFVFNGVTGVYASVCNGVTGVYALVFNGVTDVCTCMQWMVVVQVFTFVCIGITGVQA